MSIFDISLLVLIGGFVLYGLWFGLIHAFGTLIGTIAGAFLAGRFFDAIAMKFLWLFGGNTNLARIVVFILIFTIVNRLIGLVFFIFERGFKILTIIPFLTSLNRLGGAVLGFVEGAIVLGAGLYLSTKFPLGAAFTTAMAQSKFAPYLLGVASVVIPLLPELVRRIESVLPKKII